MYVVWNYHLDKPTTLNGIILFATYDDALHAMTDNGIDYIGTTLSGDCYIIERTEAVIRGETVGERLRDYYIGA